MIMTLGRSGMLLKSIQGKLCSGSHGVAYGAMLRFSIKTKSAPQGFNDQPVKATIYFDSSCDKPLVVFFNRDAFLVANEGIAKFFAAALVSVGVSLVLIAALAYAGSVMATCGVFRLETSNGQFWEVHRGADEK